jgi:hypothetical protein
MLLSLIKFKLNLDNVEELKIALKAVDDICDSGDKEVLISMLTDEFCSR